MNSYFETETPDPKSDHGLWCERYRPTEFSDFIGSNVVKETIKTFINNKEIPHLLLFGPPGTGKTSLGKMLINHIECDSLIINASDENKVDDIRTKVQDFAMTMGINPLKIMFLDEADRMTPEAMCVLRNLMETYSKHTRFILTCNYHEKLIPAIQSRCQGFEIKPPEKSECATHLAKILTKEKIKFSPQDVVFVVNSYFPDLRKIINFAQQSSVTGELKIAQENSIDSDYKIKLIELLKEPNHPDAFSDIRQLVADASFSNYDEVYKLLYEKVDEYAPGKEASVILQIADALYQSSLVFEREITFVAAMHKILTCLSS